MNSFTLWAGVHDKMIHEQEKNYCLACGELKVCDEDEICHDCRRDIDGLVSTLSYKLQQERREHKQKLHSVEV